MESALEWILTNSCKADMISYLADHPEEFKETIELALADKQPYSWRAAWLLWSCMEDNDPRVRKYIAGLISTLPAKPDNMKKDIFTILLRMEIDEEYEGILFDHCVSTWEDLGKKPAVRANAMKIMMRKASCSFACFTLTAGSGFLGDPCWRLRLTRRITSGLPG